MLVLTHRNARPQFSLPDSCTHGSRPRAFALFSAFHVAYLRRRWRLGWASHFQEAFGLTNDDEIAKLSIDCE
jgi:hypothetical protein